MPASDCIASLLKDLPKAMTSRHWEELRDPWIPRANLQVEARLFLSALLCDPAFVEMAAYWELYLGRHREELRRRLEHRFGVIDPPATLISFLYGALESWNARLARRDTVTLLAERAVFESYANRFGAALRCEICGYHFTTTDLTSMRRGLCEEFGLVLAARVHPLREGDPRKPLSTSGKLRDYTRLELDHVIPISALGQGASDNLAVVCRHCNLGKDGFLFPLESLSMFAVGALNAAYAESRNQANSIPAVVACFRLRGSRCERSGLTAAEAELTVRPIHESRWWVPWELECVAYDA